MRVVGKKHTYPWQENRLARKLPLARKRPTHTCPWQENTVGVPFERKLCTQKVLVTCERLSKAVHAATSNPSQFKLVIT